MTTKIPNILHFICISPMKFELYHYIAVLSAYKIHNPDKIYIYVDKEPVNNFYWELIKEYIVVEFVNPPRMFRGKHIPYPQYQADVIRLEKLIERGGIYMDIDNLSLKPFTDLMSNCLVMGASPKIGLNKVEQLEDIDAISNSIILTAPEHPFLIEWYDKIDQFMGDEFSWAYPAVCLPRDILLENPIYKHNTTIIDWKTNFCPFDWKVYPFIFDETQNDRLSELDTLYTIVFYQTMVYDKYLKNLNISFFNQNNIFTQLFKQYINFPLNKEPLLYKIVNTLYREGEWIALEEFSNVYIKYYKNDSKKFIERYNNAAFFLFYSYYKQNKYTHCINIYNNSIVTSNLDEELKIVAKQCLNRMLS